MPIILSVRGRSAQSRGAGLAAAAALLAACAPVRSIFKPTPNPWPASQDMRVRRDGAVLRVYGASFTDAQGARRDALEALKRYLETLRIPGENDQRQARVRRALELALPRVSEGRSQEGGHTVAVELPLDELQKALGTHYE